MVTTGKHFHMPPGHFPKSGWPILLAGLVGMHRKSLLPRRRVEDLELGLLSDLPVKSFLIVRPTRDLWHRLRWST